MSGFADRIARIRPHLRNPTAPSLYGACVMEFLFCRKYLTLPVLVELIRAERALLNVAGLLDKLREEVVFRYLVSAERGAGARDEFIRVLQDPAFADPVLLEFAKEHFTPRTMGSSPASFAASEAEYLGRVREAYRERSPLQAALGDALGWFVAGATAGRRKLDVFRVLFSNRPLWGQYRNVLRLGLPITFSFRGVNGPHPFDADDSRRLGDVFVRAARNAEVDAYRIRNDEFGDRKHRQASIEMNYEDISVLDGTSGYLAFLMSHLCILEGLPLSPYVGFTGAPKEFGQLDRVRDLGPKLAAAVQAGLRVVFVPARDFSELSQPQQHGFGVIEVRAFDDIGNIDDIARKLLEELRGLEMEFAKISAFEPVAATAPVTAPATPPIPPQVAPQKALEPAPPISAPPPVVVPQVVSSPVQQPPQPPPPKPRGDSGPLKRIEDPRPLFRTVKLRAFQECGGYAHDTFSRTSVYNSADDTFVTLFPERHRLYLFDAFGGLLIKKSSEDLAPTCIAYRHDPAEYLIGFLDGTVGRYSAGLAGPHGKYRLPPGVVAKSMVTAARDVFVRDESFGLYRLPPASEPQRVAAPGTVHDLAYDPATDCLVAAAPRAIMGLSRDGKEMWRAGHAAPSAVVACSPSGDLWAALSTGRLLRFSSQDHRLLLDVPTLGNIVGLIALDNAVVVAAECGDLVLYNLQGREIGRDSLKVKVFHLAAGEGNILIVSTGRGPTVLQPLPLGLRAPEHDDVKERSLRTIVALEESLIAGNISASKEFAAGLDLARWPEMLALQQTIAHRRLTKPQQYKQLETIVRRADPRKADVLFHATRPVFVDGSNVSREHWRGSKDENRRSRLSAILAMERILAGERNPVLYPIIIVVDMSERRWSDDHARLVRLIDEGVILETPTEREADALILNLVGQHRWLDCEIVSNDKKLYRMHSEMLSEVDERWYEKVRRAFVIHPKSRLITFVQASR